MPKQSLTNMPHSEINVFYPFQFPPKSGQSFKDQHRWNPNKNQNVGAALDVNKWFTQHAFCLPSDLCSIPTMVRGEGSQEYIDSQSIEIKPAHRL